MHARQGRSPALPRRRFLGGLAGLAGACWLPQAAAQAGAVHRQSRVLMGTRVDVVVQGPHPERAAQAALAQMAQLEAMMSRYRGDSVVSALNRAAGRGAVRVPPELMQVLKAARQRAMDTDGHFDVTVGSLQAWDFRPGARGMPDAAVLRAQRALVGIEALELDASAGTARLRRAGVQIDLGGIAKLPILKAGLEVLRQEGAEGALVNGGGDVLVHGLVGDRPWRVGLRDPRRPDTLLGHVELSHQGVVAASGDYERFRLHQGRRLHHILDPRTGQPTHGVRGVVLVGERPEAVNGLGVALMVGGPDWARAWALRHRGIEVLLVEAGGAVWMSDGLARRGTVNAA